LPAGGPARLAPGVYRRTPPHWQSAGTVKWSAPGPVTAPGFLALVRLALAEHQAHLVGVDGGRPGTPEDAAEYGWSAGPGGCPQPHGPCIGIAGPCHPGQRVTLLPVAAYEAACRAAVRVPGAGLTSAFPQVDLLLRQSGLAVPENAAGGQAGARRVWELPAAVLFAAAAPGAGQPGKPRPAHRP
jgi:hypothetical protein